MWQVVMSGSPNATAGWVWKPSRATDPPVQKGTGMTRSRQRRKVRSSRPTVLVIVILVLRTQLFVLVALIAAAALVHGYGVQAAAGLVASAVAATIHLSGRLLPLDLTPRRGTR